MQQQPRGMTHSTAIRRLCPLLTHAATTTGLAHGQEVERPAVGWRTALACCRGDDAALLWRAGEASCGMTHGRQPLAASLIATSTFELFSSDAGGPCKSCFLTCRGATCGISSAKQLGTIMGSSLQIGSSLKDAPSRGEEEPAENGSSDSGGRQQRRRTLRATSRRGGKKAALQQRCSEVWNGMVRHEEEADTSGNEPARRQGGSTSAEVCNVVWHLRRTGECGGMTHGRQPLACGCLLLALLTTRSRQGGHVGQRGKHANLGERGKEDTWGKEEEATRRHFSTALPAPSLPALTPNPTCTPSSSPSHRRGGRTGSLQRHVRHGHRPPCTSSSSFDAQPDLRSVLIPFPPSRKAHGESTASRSARGEAEEREGVVDGLDE
ncbi:unnamed protein product [Closterium sp. Yama58-4]|nr:unnamed protein product [Closterium sp. Yama58-4]